MVIDNYLMFKKHYCTDKEYSESEFRKEFEFYNEVYSVLVAYGRASEYMRENFVFCHISKQEYPCDEYRFGGVFGIGGKYRRLTNTIDYYQEDATKQLDKLEKIINARLKEVRHEDNK